MTNLIRMSVVLIILFYGCKQSNTECIITQQINNGNKVIKRQIDQCSNNLVKSEQEFTTNSNGNLVADGYYKEYYANGQIKNLSYYDKRLQNCTSLTYYENGLISKKGYLVGDKAMYPMGAQYYYSQTNFVDSIEEYSKVGEKWATLRFDKDKNVKSVDGKLIHFTLSKRSPYFDSIPIKFPLFLIGEIVKIDGIKTTLNMNIKQKNVIVLNTITTDFSKIYNLHMAGIKHSFNRKGNYEFRTVVTLTDSISGKELYVDTFSRIINVY